MYGAWYQLMLYFPIIITLYWGENRQLLVIILILGVQFGQY